MNVFFGLDYKTYDEDFKNEARKLGLNSAAFTTPVSRIGAATDGLNNHDLNYVRLDGGLAMSKSAERYILECRARLTELKMTEKEQEKSLKHRKF